MPTIRDVYAYWNANPLLSHELAGPGSASYFAALDRVKRLDSERFALAYWEFGSYIGKKVLDIGCGPGWLVVQYSAGGAQVSAVDLTQQAIEITRRHLDSRKLSADIQVGNAENLPFPDRQFDLVVASGVLHHTPNTQAAFAEAFRVTRPGGEAKITLYRKGILHSRALFGATRAAMRLARLRHPGADLGQDAVDVDDFIRRYDGDGNPVGIGKSDGEWAADLRAAGWQVLGHEVHFFPRRFLPFSHLVPGPVHWLLDRGFGTMVYFRLRRPPQG
jgi:SAM-dependent methyltransferase